MTSSLATFRHPAVRIIATALALALVMVSLAAPSANAISGKSYGWGSNSHGKVGNGTDDADVLEPSSVTMPSGVSYFKQFVSSNAGSCALGSDDKTYCWGENAYGFVGDGTWDDRSVPTPVTMPSGVTAFVNIYATYGQACALAADGTAYCWGENFSGQLGVGDILSKNTPMAVNTGAKFKSLVLDTYNTCGITTIDTTYCWGDRGANGNGLNQTETSPVLVNGGNVYASIVPGESTFCGLTAQGTAWCWGNNFYGTAGDGTNTNAMSPVLVAGGHTFAKLFGGNDAVCGLTSEGAGWCWGSGGLGALGQGSSSNSNVPVAISGGHAFSTIMMSQTQSTCALTTTGQAWCWGQNAQGQAGDGGSPGIKNAPVAVVGGHTFASLTRSREVFCGVTTAGKAYCWGDGRSGGIGDGTTNTNNSTPAAVTLPSGVERFGEVVSGFWSNTLHSAPRTDEPVVNTRPGKPRDPKVKGAPSGSKFVVSWKKSVRATPETKYRVDVRLAGKSKILIRKYTKGLKVKLTRKQLLAATPRMRGDMRGLLVYRVTIVAITGSLKSAPALTKIRLVR